MHTVLFICAAAATLVVTGAYLAVIGTSVLATVQHKRRVCRHANTCMHNVGPVSSIEICLDCEAERRWAAGQCGDWNPDAIYG